MTREELIEDVQVRLDELSPFDDIEEVPAINYIDKMLNAATDSVFRLLPYYKLPLKSIPTVTDGGDGVYIAAMPDNFIKIGEVFLTGWSRVVKELADKNTEKLQGGKHTRGTKSKPVVVLRRNSSGSKLYLYSTDASSPTANISVVVSELPEECPDELGDAIAWQCASDVLLSLGKNDAAKVAQEKVMIHGI